MHQKNEPSARQPRARSDRRSRALPALVLLAGVATWAFSSPVLSAPMRVTCEADYGGRLERVQLIPTDDVFDFSVVTVGERFRFQAQWLSQRAKLKTQVHEVSERSVVLLHAAEYPMPAHACPQRAGLVALNKVYSPSLQRELFFQCQLDCE